MRSGSLPGRASTLSLGPGTHTKVRGSVSEGRHQILSIRNGVKCGGRPRGSPGYQPMSDPECSKQMVPGIHLGVTPIFLAPSLPRAVAGPRRVTPRRAAAPRGCTGAWRSAARRPRRQVRRRARAVPALLRASGRLMRCPTRQHAGYRPARRSVPSEI